MTKDLKALGAVYVSEVWMVYHIMLLHIEAPMNNLTNVRA